MLVAEGLSPSVWHAYDGYVLGVPPAEAERAVAALSAYDSENPLVSYEDEAPAGVMHVYAALVVVALLLDFFFVTEVWDQTFPWIERGSADAGRIVQGELWRVVTALTLHAGLMHALANAIAGGANAHAASNAGTAPRAPSRRAMPSRRTGPASPGVDHGCTQALPEPSAATTPTAKNDL